MTSKRAGRVLIALGALCIIAAVVLLCHNRAEERRADDAAQSAMPAVVQGIAEARAVRTNTAPARDPDVGVEAEGERYLGFLSLPSLSLELPVLYDWDGVKLQSAPCRYSGSLAAGALVLGAHNYSYHFGGIAELAPGDAVYFTDGNGDIHAYTVALTETLDPDEVNAMIETDYPLTLFTCTYGGARRVTVRCEAQK